MIILGMVLGVITRVGISLLGGNKLEGLVVALLVMSGLDEGMVIGFFSTFIGLKGLSAAGEVLNPINMETEIHSGVVSNFVSQGFGMVLIRQWVALDGLFSIMIMGMGVLIAPNMWSDTSSRWFNEISIRWSPLIMLGVIVTIMMRMEGAAKIKYLLGLIMVGGYGVLIVVGGVGNQFSMMIALSLLFGGVSGIGVKYKLPKQEWSKELGWGSWAYDPYSLIVGAMSALFIGTPSSAVMSAIDGNDGIAIDRYQNSMVASIIGSNVSLLLWFWYGSSRSSYADSMSKAGVSVIDNHSLLIGMVLVMMTMMVIVLQYITEWSEFYYYFIKKVVPIKLINLGSYVLTLVVIMVLGVNLPTLCVLVSASIIINRVMEGMEVPKECKVGTVMIVPLFTIYLMPLLG